MSKDGFLQASQEPGPFTRAAAQALSWHSPGPFPTLLSESASAMDSLQYPSQTFISRKVNSPSAPIYPGGFIWNDSCGFCSSFV